MNALNELNRIDKPAEAAPELEQQQVQTPPGPLRDLIELPSGIQVYMLNENELAGSEYFEFLRISRTSGAEEGIQHLIFSCFIDVATGKSLQPEQVLDQGGIGFRGVADLSEHILKLFPAAQAKLN